MPRPRMTYDQAPGAVLRFPFPNRFLKEDSMQKPDLILAPNVVFNAADHTYHKHGHRLSGVTGVIGKHLGIKFPEEFVGEARGEGLHVHQAIEKWINDPEAKVNSVHPAVLWLVKTLVERCPSTPKYMYSEVLVSDGAMYASSVDIVAVMPDDSLFLFDMKRSFKRPSVTLQLSVYKYFIEKFTDRKVFGLCCASFREQEYYSIFPRTHEECEQLLYKTPKQERKS